MNEPASDVIAARARAAGDADVAARVERRRHTWRIVAVIWLAPVRRSVGQRRATVMTISLGGAPGPRTGGLTAIGRPRGAGTAARAAEAHAAHAAATAAPGATGDHAADRRSRCRRGRHAPSRRRQAGRPRRRSRRATAAPASRPARAARASASRPAAAVQKGIEVETPNFCCPGYLEQMVRVAIERAWDRAPGRAGVTTLRFRILRNGTIDGISVVRIERQPADRRRRLARASGSTQTLPELPREFPDSSLALRMRFENR